MKDHLEIYKCTVCGKMTQVIHEGNGELVCCHKPMTKLVAGITDAAQEKHVPVVSKSDCGYDVVVGSVAHPMEDKHYIEWIEVIADGTSFRKFLKPGEEPKASFCVKADNVEVREYCNLHGVWKKES